MNRLTYDEIRSIITTKYGFTDIQKYQAFFDNYDSTKAQITQENIDLLSPDNVNCIDFWKVCDELFSTDAVANSCTYKHVNYTLAKFNDITNANRVNLHLAKSLGVLHFIDEFAYSDNLIIEIGAGYGNLKNYIEVNTKQRYVGFDVIPRVPGIRHLTSEGKLDTYDIDHFANTAYMVVMNNVMQHLSTAQKIHYFESAYKLLIPGGLFIFNLVCDCGQKFGFVKDGVPYMFHYGQYTPIPKSLWINEQLLERSLRPLYTTFRFDGVMNFVAQKV